jgi:hypothetical protein
MQMVHIDQYVFFIVIGLFVVMHIGLLTWLRFVPLKHRKDMKNRDVEYQLSLTSKKNNQSHDNNNNGGKANDSPPFARIPIEA